MLEIYTSRITYAGPGRLDITAKSADEPYGSLLKPNWNLVNNLKGGILTWEEYREKYMEYIRGNYAKEPGMFHKMVVEAAVAAGRMVLCCYCNHRECYELHQCHRFLAADIVTKVASKVGYEAKYKGEIQ